MCLMETMMSKCHERHHVADTSAIKIAIIIIIYYSAYLINIMVTLR